MTRPDDPLWEELGNIDYLLDHLARAVERGEIPRDSYDVVASRHLARRAEIADVLEARARHASQEYAPPMPAMRAESSARAAGPPAQRPIRVPAQQREVPWTTILTITGAFLVIVASAIFAVATWDLFGVGFRLGFLGALTVAFFGTGFLVRSRLRLVGGGVALVAVGSAMLLFDGWIAIDGYELDGPWPWVGWLLVCWAVYWAVEVVVGGRFFGIIGAAAQVVWLWILGQGLGWDTAPRMAAIALVGLAWTLAGRRAEGHAPYASLAGVLK
ncbi:MAG: hypothetical protein OEV43_06500, partial [Coriobacteriia bacterium]|nr:hypothetical protein [Coriobacteriia bacterium]